MKNLLLRRGFLLGIKIFSILCALFLTGIEVSNQLIRPVISNNSIIDFYSLRRLLGNSFIVILFILLSINPQKLGILAICSFYYAITCSIFDSDNPIGICMYFLGICVLYVRGEFFFKTKQRIIEVILLYLIILLSNIYLGLNAFLNDLLNKLGYTFVLGIIDFLFIASLEYHRTPKIDNSKILNIADYPGLVKNDVLLLKEVLAKKQYKEIAIDLYRAEGTIRNRLNKIYDILGVMDRMGFISTYMGYEIVFQKDDSTSENKTVNNILYKKKKKKKKKK